MKIFSSKNNIPTKHSLLIEEEDVFADLLGEKSSVLFLGRYSLSEVAAVLKKRNFYKEAKKRKLWPLVFHMDNSEFPLQRFQIYFQEKNPENLVVDLKIREGSFRPQKKLSSRVSLSQYKFLILEWLTLQNPLQRFSRDHTALPGQKYPGLNLGKKVLDLFVYLARLSKLDGLLAFPAYFHNALLFYRYFSFLNPEKKAEVLTIRKSFRDVSFKQLAWIVHLECLLDKHQTVYKWQAEEQAYPLNKEIKEYFNSKEYEKEVRESQEGLEFSIDWDCYKKKKDVQIKSS
jgi:hypothetical protein